MFTLKEFLLQEAKQTKTKTADTTTDWASIFQDMQQQGLDRQQNVPAPAPKPQAEEPRQQKQASSGLRQASADRTRERVGNVAVSPEMADKFSSMDMSGEDTISDDQARINAQTPGQVDPDLRLPNPNKTEQSTMPALISKALAKTGGIDPEWHAVKHLPGYLQSGIRSIGRAVFAPFTKTPIEEIQVLANVNGSGPNDQEELDAVLGFLARSGARATEMEMEFHDKIPDYRTQLRVYTALGHTFVTVKDFAGKYIYSWKTAEGDLEKLRVQDQPERPALGVDRPRLR
jgi:hypothetical protein